MQCLKFGVPGWVLQFASYPMSVAHPIVDTETTVTLSRLATQPWPTFIDCANLDLSPKPFFQWNALSLPRQLCHAFVMLNRATFAGSSACFASPNFYRVFHGD
jgi:hypothetical protein